MVAVMGGFYPELVAKRDHIHAVIKCALSAHCRAVQWDRIVNSLSATCGERLFLTADEEPCKEPAKRITAGGRRTRSLASDQCYRHAEGLRRAAGREEEVSFSRTLVKGLELFKKAAAAAEGGQLAGRDAFLLWDTFGFPLDLTQACPARSTSPRPQLVAADPSWLLSRA